MRKNKYNATRTEVNGIFFASKREAEQYGDLLKKLEKNEITDLVLQPTFKFPCGIKYKGDFRYMENGRDVVEDIKGFVTATFRLKAKMFRFHYPEIELRITK